MQINPVIVFREEFDGSGVLFDPDSGEAFELSDVSTLIWKGLRDGLDKAAILERLAAACEDGIPPEAGRDFDEFVDQLEAKGLVRP